MSFWGLQNSLAVKYVCCMGFMLMFRCNGYIAVYANVVMFHSGVFGIADKGFD
ncbi:hypothetical protein OK116_03465 [Xylella fastidiosa subsp. fastidiosa]|nr:hypothetical protein [Xylella fastidiosa]WCF17877.1 hypothetical protein OK116_03465 [Xylella fastidiosa subsp. fastidiosa]